MSSSANNDTSVESLEVSSPEVAAEKRVWATPSFEEFDYTITQGAGSGLWDGVGNTYS
jgi:hypothetical protein